MEHINIFISAVTDEFGSYRGRLCDRLSRPGVDASIQDKFYAAGAPTLIKLDNYIKRCTAVIHLVGNSCGAPAHKASVAALQERYPDLGQRLPCLRDALAGKEELTYTQWEAILALYHGKHLIVAVPTDAAPRDNGGVVETKQQAAQQRHLSRLLDMHVHPAITFPDVNSLLADVALSDLLELVQKAQLKPAETLHSDGQAAPENFMGREEELDMIWERLADDGKLMLINAEGGIGKTTLAAKYWQQSRYYYRHNAWLYCENGIINKLKDLAPKLGVDLRDLNEEDQLTALKGGLLPLAHNCLLVLDNADREEDIIAFQKVFRGFPWHVLLTSRLSGVLDAAQEYPIEHLPPPMAKALFKSYYSAEEGTEYEALLDRFLEGIGYHTLLIEIFSKYLAGLETDELFADVLQQLEDKGLFLGWHGA